jgi:3-oxoacyl-ACP reductase-like protein
MFSSYMHRMAAQLVTLERRLGAGPAGARARAAIDALLPVIETEPNDATSPPVLRVQFTPRRQPTLRVCKVCHALCMMHSFSSRFVDPAKPWRARGTRKERHGAPLQDTHLQDRVVVVTGAGGSLGSRTVATMAAAGAHVVATGRTETSIRRLSWD